MTQLNEKLDMFSNRLSKVYKHLGKQAKRQQISCYRIYDHDLPEFPFCIDFYADHLYVAEYKRNHGMSDEAHEVWIMKCKEVMSAALSIEMANIFVKMRMRKPGRLGQYQKLDEAKNEFEVKENGLSFLVNLTDYLDTGLFLDHRITRQYVREHSAGKRVLNLFAYTGSFSVYAAAGGASKVETVDLSKTYLQWAERNMQLNGFVDQTKYSFTHADVKQYLRTIPAESFDIIVMDPPTFSNSKRMDDILDIQRDHAELINAALAALAIGGELIFSTNFTKFILDKPKIKTDKIKDLTRFTTPFDFEGKLSRYCFQFIK
jgi:23S rRNA (cytosine1962-C5)-methyltransferase